MAKKKDKKVSRADTVRAAVDQAFQVTAQATADAGQLTRGRATEIADELVGNITRLRAALDDARPATAEDIKVLRAEIASLGERVGRLETARAAAAITGKEAPAGEPTAPPAKAATAPRGAKPAGAKPSARASASRTAAAKRTTAAKPKAKKPAAAAKPKAKKPAAAAKPKPAAPVKTGAAGKKP